MVEEIEIKRPRGRPSTYTPELGSAICQAIAEGGSLRGICDALGVPVGTCSGWIVANVEGFADRYWRARMAGALMHADEILQLSDAEPERLATGGIDSGWVNLQRLRVHSREWLLSRLVPSRYGDRADISQLAGPTVVVDTGVPRPEESPPAAPVPVPSKPKP